MGLFSLFISFLYYSLACLRMRCVAKYWLLFGPIPLSIEALFISFACLRMHCVTKDWIVFGLIPLSINIIVRIYGKDGANIRCQKHGI